MATLLRTFCIILIFGFFDLQIGFNQLNTLAGGHGQLLSTSAWAQVPQTSPTKIDRSLPGSRLGQMTKAQRGTVVIDRTTYALAPQVLIEERSGMSLTPQDLQWWEGEFDVQYWIGTGELRNQIIQMIVAYPQ